MERIKKGKLKNEEKIVKKREGDKENERDFTKWRQTANTSHIEENRKK